MAVDFFLKLEGIEGEAEETHHKNQIQIMSWSWGGSNVSSVAGTGGSGAGKVNLSDFTIMTYFDKSTPKFFRDLCKGTHIKTGEMDAMKAGEEGKPYLKVHFKELFITSLSISGSSEIPTVSLSFTYDEIKIDYYKQNESGQLTTTGPVTYNLKQSKVS